jgi:hypothetical protein
MDHGMARIRHSQPDAVFKFFQDLADTGNKMNHQVVVFGLQAFVEDDSFENLPRIFDCLAQILNAEESGLVKEITRLISALQKESEDETVNFLVRQIPIAAQPRVFRITRQALNKFNEENQQILRETLAKHT